MDEKFCLLLYIITQPPFRSLPPTLKVLSIHPHAVYADVRNEGFQYSIDKHPAGHSQCSVSCYGVKSFSGYVQRHGGVYSMPFISRSSAIFLDAKVFAIYELAA